MAASQHSLVEAVKERYCNEQADQGDLDGLVHIVLPKGARNKLDGSSERQQVPRQLVLHKYDIEKAGSEEDLTKLCCHITELDLAENKLREWKEVTKMLTQLPNVHFVNLSSNFLQYSSCSPSEGGQTFPHVTHLVLNSLHLSWPVITQLLNVFPSLVQLHLSLNGYTTVDLPSDQTFPSVECLHFNGNKVCEWSAICRLGQSFPGLVQLVLAENPVASLGGVVDVASCFPHLTSLLLGRCQIASWSELEKLNALPCLTDLRIPDIPLLTTGSIDEKLGRQLTVGYLPGVSKLNGSSVMANEREDAERAFIRHYMDQPSQPNRYTELVTVYGKLDRLVEVDLEPKKQLDCVVKCGSRSKLWKVNLGHTVGEFKKSLEEFVGAPRAKWRLYYSDSTWLGTGELKLNGYKLFSINFPEGTEFIIDMK